MDPNDLQYELPDDDPDVIAGMKRLAELREVEHQAIEFPSGGLGVQR